MGIRVGIPVLKLSRNATPTKRKGDARKVVLESFKERYSKDQDLDRSRSNLNVYTGFQRGKDLYEFWEKEASGHLDAKGRKLRADAVIGYSFIIKPDKESMDKMSDLEQMRFLDDSMKVLSDLFQSQGLPLDATALHMDEVNPHVHAFGHDPEYKAGKKIDIRLFGMLNREYPKRMRELGYDVEDLTVYDSEKADTMTEEERADYKEEVLQRKKAKKNAGRSSNQYKDEKLAEREKEIQIRENALRASILGFNAEKDRYWQNVEKEREKANEAFESELKQKRHNEKVRLEKEIEKYKSERFSEVDEEIEKYKSEKISELKQAVGNAYTAEMDFRTAKTGYEESLKRLPDLVIRELNQKSVRVNGQAVPVGNYHAEAIRRAVQNIHVTSETVYVERNAEKSMRAVREIASMEGVVNNWEKEKLETDYGLGY